MTSKNKKAQEEMVGFALIVILVAVILLVFLGFSLNKSRGQNIKSYEADSFLQSMLQYTTQCKDNFGYLSVKDLIFACSSGNQCLDGSDSCSTLNSTLEGIMNQSWIIEKGSPIKGYELSINSSNGNTILIKTGNSTLNSKGSSQDFSKSGTSINILLKIYS